MNSCKGGERERGREGVCETKVNNVQCYNYRHIIFVQYIMRKTSLIMI